MQRTMISSVTPGSVATRAPAALAARRESVCVSDFDVGQSTTSNRVIRSATSGGGSSPLLLRGSMSTSSTSRPSSMAAALQGVADRAAAARR